MKSPIISCKIHMINPLFGIIWTSIPFYTKFYFLSGCYKNNEVAPIICSITLIILYIYLPKILINSVGVIMNCFTGKCFIFLEQHHHEMIETQKLLHLYLLLHFEYYYPYISLFISSKLISAVPFFIAALCNCFIDCTIFSYE